MLGTEDVNSRLSARNLPGVTILEPAQLNTYDVLNADDVVFSVEALNDFINRRQNTASAGVAAAAAAAEEEK